MAKAKLKWNKAAPPQIMQSPEIRAVVGTEVDRVAGNLDPDDYGSIVESGGDRARGAVWTISPAAKKRTARDGELLRALTGGGS